VSSSIQKHPASFNSSVSGSRLRCDQGSATLPLAEALTQRLIMINDTDQTIQFPSTISKRRTDGIVCGSDHLKPGEELLDGTETRASQRQQGEPHGE
jgi:hypothetical protein